MLLFAMVLACGQYIPADQAASGTSVIPAEVVLPDASDMSQSTRLQHYGYSSLLSAHTIDVDWRGGTSVALEWDALQQSLEAQATLGHSLALLASVDPVTLENRNEKLAYWLNLYTGWVVQAVLLARAEDPGFESVSNNNFSLFDAALIRLGDQYWTLNQVESGVIRGALEDHEQLFAGQPTLAALAADWHSDLWQDGPIDARIHMGLHCASRSCPDIPSMAWRGVDLDETLVHCVKKPNPLR